MTPPLADVEFKPVAFDTDFAHIINGHSHNSPSTLTILSPSTRETVGTVPRATEADVDAAIVHARAAQPAWAALPWSERARAVHQLGELLDHFRPELARLLTKETGKPIKAVSEWEINGAMHWFKGMADMEVKPETVETPAARFTQRYVPLGTGVVIVPWNYPMILMALKVAPGLLSGNTVIVKPAPTTPLTTLKFVELAQQILPPGVLSCLSGSDDLGPMLTGHPGIDMVAFTGSTPTGSAVMRSCAGRMARTTLELGGNDAAIVLGDVDPKKVAEKLFWAMFSNAGQVCVAAKRVYVHEEVYEQVKEALLDIAGGLRYGDGAEEEVTMGPVQNEPQFKRIQELVKDCEQKGYKMHAAGSWDKQMKGFFMPITLVDNPPEDSRVVVEEPFGPIAPLLKWSDEEDVIRRANASEFGLGASVWGADVARCERIGQRLHAGTVWINQWLVLHARMAFGGHKRSGLGVEGSLGGITAWMNTHVVSVNKDESVVGRE